MNFRTTFTIPQSENLLTHEDSVTLFGSCFSDRIGQKLRYFGFDVLVNPFGTIFHPMAIANLLMFDKPLEIRTLKRDADWFTFDTHSQIRASSEMELQSQFFAQRELLTSYLSKSKLLVITLGSSWGYYLNDQIVANCHKTPAKQFEKRLTDLEEMTKTWKAVTEKLNQQYPKLELMFTVSPVRHIKDGIIENQRSKSRLIELCHALEVSYFPAYEFLMDDLRDYRFYDFDMIHPNNTAVEYIFEQFSHHKISDKSRMYFPVIHKFRQFESHEIRPFDQEKYDEHQQNLEQKRAQLRCAVKGILI